MRTIEHDTKDAFDAIIPQVDSLIRFIRENSVNLANSDLMTWGRYHKDIMSLISSFWKLYFQLEKELLPREQERAQAEAVAEAAEEEEEFPPPGEEALGVPQPEGEAVAALRARVDFLEGDLRIVAGRERVLKLQRKRLEQDLNKLERENRHLKRKLRGLRKADETGQE